MDSSYFPIPFKRLPDLPPRLGHSVLTWDGSERELETPAAPELPQWAIPPRVPLPHQLALTGPIGTADRMNGHHFVVRRNNFAFTSTPLLP